MFGHPRLGLGIRRRPDFGEAERLHTTATGRLELPRTQEPVRALLPPGPARILDVGGSPGTHARRLAEDGHVPKHLAQASAYAACTTELGDARALTAAEASFDAVLLLGPLHHLNGPGEVADVRRHGGYDGSRGFRTSAELRDEAVAAGLTGLRIHGVEGPGWAYLRAAERTAGAPRLDSPLLDGALATARLGAHPRHGPHDEHRSAGAVSSRPPPSDPLPARTSAPARR
ncbi:class I SAM-dependent methyltransferase [Streptomyces erythrochromogenes]|uniref:class I SAM-dependent methyltransferase n=1 Tax=Streptomyces erythrochromogenes TaxID=285574 RepID=UPI00369E5673